MTRPAAIRAQYCDWKLIKTRSVVQLVFEVDVSQSNDAYEVLGGMPQPNQWFAIAALNEQGKASDTQVIPGEVDIYTGESSSQPRPRRSWDELTPTQQAGIRCNETAFHAFLRENYQNEWNAESDGYPEVCVRFICRVNSRKYLTTNPQARTRWLALENQYQAWLAKQAIA